MFASYPSIGITGSLILSFVVVLAAIPTIVKVAYMKHLYAVANERAAHIHNIPTLGGLAIFAGLVLSMLIFIDIKSCERLQYIIAACIIIFFIGIKDDILVTAPITKLSGQLVASFIITVIGDIRLTHLHGFFGIHALPYWASISISIFGIVVITNAFNLIDGIDGLASGVGIVTATTFGAWFFVAQQYQLTIMAAALIGALSGFFIYNVFGKENKIFMGDTGALLIGLIMSVLTIFFNESNIITDYPARQWYQVTAAPSVSFGILIVPLFDVLRVMFIRFFLGRPLFKGDKKHIHHQLLELKYTHLQSTLIICCINVLFIAFVFYFNSISIRRLLLIELIIAAAISYIPVIILESKTKTGRTTTNNNKLDVK